MRGEDRIGTPERGREASQEENKHGHEQDPAGEEEEDAPLEDTQHAQVPAPEMLISFVINVLRVTDVNRRVNVNANYLCKYTLFVYLFREGKLFFTCLALAYPQHAVGEYQRDT